MPVLTGRVVGDAERSERFLMDFRRTIADMLAENHYGVLADVAHQRGMRMYSEAAGTDLPTVIDGLQAKGRSTCRWANTGSTPKAGNRKPITSPMFARPRPRLTPMADKSSRPKH